ncbi:cation/acetate symporter ActP [Brenneria izadpanahii]|uniref:Cation/acetate symporter ActP n=1 Tax=Brenneria izadpanahii TaxID=2722756 RepID=A0ABX7UWI8_9GAMM|nr:sodium/solute symporter [Brenneria izadpanahii]QTF08525.1 cation/acetate symporter ActP [Brenneria izadpanahii]
MMKMLIFLCSLLAMNSAYADTGVAQGASSTAITLFLLIIAVTLYITWWAAKRTRTASDFYNAGGQISGFQNGLAIAGDAMSAGALLGLSALVFTSGFDGLIYAIGYTTGLPLVVFLMAGRMRRMGKFTFIDVVCSRLEGRSVRVFSACASLIIVLFYLIAQMVGAGQLIQMLFGIDYVYAIMLVGILMVLYVTFGGMMATTWVQIVKAVLMICGCLFISFLVMKSAGYSFSQLLNDAVGVHPSGQNILLPSALARDPVSGISLAIALMLGTAGLPHVLMRFFTVPDARAARSSVLWATIFMNGFYAMIFIIGFGALYLLRTQPQLFDASGALIGGTNTAALHLAYALGGDPLFGFLSAVAFATILAVVAGLTISGASAISHDIYGCLFGRKPGSEQREMRIMKAAVLVLGIIAVLLGIAFKGQNIAYMISLAFSISCSSTFPVLILAIYWRRFSARGAVWGGATGLIASLALTILGPSVWVKVLGYAAPAFSIDPPAIITVPLAFTVAIAVSLLERRPLQYAQRQVS